MRNQSSIEQLNRRIDEYADQIKERFRQQAGDVLTPGQMQRCNEAAVTLAEVGVLSPFAVDDETRGTLERRKQLAYTTLGNYAVRGQISAATVMRDIAIDVLGGAVALALAAI